MVLTAYAIIITLGWILTTIYLLVNSRKIMYLKNISSASTIAGPAVAIIIAVKDEEAEVEEALNSVCNLDYDNFKIIVINDRSADRTPQILSKMAERNPAISVITIKDLPGGWLGKNHALYQGYLASSDEWLLFTDADILYGRQALKKAMSYALENKLDHLTALPEITSRSWLFVSVLNTFAVLLETRLQTWNVSNPASKASIGVGAFNLVKRSAYEKAGTHTVISLRPDDDLKLGERIKKAGLRQDVVYGEKEISLQWYTSLHEFVRGLMKNTFAVSNYQLSIAIASAVAIFAIIVMPIPVLLFQGQNGLFMALAILVAQILLLLFKRGIHGQWWHALMMPFAGLVMIYIIVKSAIQTIRQGGIYWRSSFYQLDELKKQR